MSILIRMMIGIAVGGFIGFAVYRFVGCRAGGCPITSNPYLSMLFGAAAGFFASLI